MLDMSAAVNVIGINNGVCKFLYYIVGFVICIMWGVGCLDGIWIVFFFDGV